MVVAVPLMNKVRVLLCIDCPMRRLTGDTEGDVIISWQAPQADQADQAGRPLAVPRLSVQKMLQPNSLANSGVDQTAPSMVVLEDTRQPVREVRRRHSRC